MSAGRMIIAGTGLGKSGSNQVFYVDNNQDGTYKEDGSLFAPYKDLDDAYSAAIDGDAIYIVPSSSTYTLPSALNKKVSLFGLGDAERTKVSASGTAEISVWGGEDQHCSEIHNIQFADDTQLSITKPRWHFKNCSFQKGVYIAAASANRYDMPFENCSFYSNSTSIENLEVRGTAIRARLIDCLLHMVPSSGDQNNIKVDNNAHLFMHNCYVENDTSWGAINVSESAGADSRIFMYSCTVRNTSTGKTLEIGGAATAGDPNVVDSCTFYGDINNTNGAYIVWNDNMLLSGSLTGTKTNYLYRPASEVDNDSSVTGDTVKDALETLKSLISDEDLWNRDATHGMITTKNTGDGVELSFAQWNSKSALSKTVGTKDLANVEVDRGRAVRWDYIIYNDANSATRTGSVMAIWDASGNVEYAESKTDSNGSTGNSTAVTLQAVYDASPDPDQVKLQAVITGGDTWNFYISELMIG